MEAGVLGYKGFILELLLKGGGLMKIEWEKIVGLGSWSR